MVLTNQLIYLVNVKTIRGFSNHVSSSKKLNFNSIIRRLICEIETSFKWSWIGMYYDLSLSNFAVKFETRLMLCLPLDCNSITRKVTVWVAAYFSYESGLNYWTWNHCGSNPLESYWLGSSAHSYSKSFCFGQNHFYWVL